MKDDYIIEVKNVSKKYLIRHNQDATYDTFRDVLVNTITKPFKFLKGKGKTEDFWAVKDVNFKVKKGEVIGIIGRNGAGKSTVLKLLSRITYPTTGEIVIKGKVGSLLEVGTGFHPELTGRENIYLNGGILGMSRREIQEKFDQIVEFSGVEKFLDTQVKHYSSGMGVRLAFAIAAHLEPDILIIDEVLAVGDAEFQKKCLGKMEEVTQKNGRTILFVSHNMAAIKQLCPKTILIEKGSVKMIGETSKVIEAYLEEQAHNLESAEYSDVPNRQGNQKVSFTNAKVLPRETNDLKIKLGYNNKTGEIIKNAKAVVEIYNSENIRLAYITNTILNQNIDLKPGENSFTLTIKNCNLGTGRYHTEIFMTKDAMDSETFDRIEQALFFEIDNDLFYPTKQLPPVKSQILFDYQYEQ